MAPKDYTEVEPIFLINEGEPNTILVADLDQDQFYVLTLTDIAADTEVTELTELTEIHYSD